MKLTVLTSPESWYWNDLCRAARGRHELHSVPFSRLAARLPSRDPVRMVNDDAELLSYDAVLVRTMPPGSLEQVVFRMDALGCLESAGVPVINPPRSLEAAVDKYLTTAKLDAAGLPVPATVVCQTVEQAMQAFIEFGGRAVIKPLFGGEGRGIFRVDDEALALRAVKALLQLDAVLYLQQFIDHPGFDVRVLLIGSQALAIRRHNRQDWRTNISRGGRAEAIDIDDATLQLARRAADAVGAIVAGVDLLYDPSGSPFVLEVNAVPGWKAVAGAHRIDVAAMILELIEAIVRSPRASTPPGPPSRLDCEATANAQAIVDP